MAHVADHLSVEELEAAFRTARDGSRSRHFQTIWLLASGRTITETAAVTRFAPRWIEELLARYNALGPEALGDLRRQNGAPAKILIAPILERVRERLKESPDDGGVWTSVKMAAFIAAELGLDSVRRQRGWEALKAIEWSIQSPRPRYEGAASAEEQAAFKKSSPQRSRRNASVIRTR